MLPWALQRHRVVLEPNLWLREACKWTLELRGQRAGHLHATLDSAVCSLTRFVWSSFDYLLPRMPPPPRLTGRRPQRLPHPSDLRSLPPPYSELEPDSHLQSARPRALSVPSMPRPQPSAGGTKLGQGHTASCLCLCVLPSLLPMAPSHALPTQALLRVPQARPPSLPPHTPCQPLIPPPSP